MKTIDKQAVFAVFKTYITAEDDAYKQVMQARANAVKALHKLGVTTYEQAKLLAVEFAGQAKKCPMVEGRGKAQGTMVLNREHPNYENAKKFAQRICGAFNKPEPTSERKEVDVVAALLKRYESLTPAQKRAFKASI